jgi:hypothetical protein
MSIEGSTNYAGREAITGSILQSLTRAEVSRALARDPPPRDKRFRDFAPLAVWRFAASIVLWPLVGCCWRLTFSTARLF